MKMMLLDSASFNEFASGLGDVFGSSENQGRLPLSM